MGRRSRSDVDTRELVLSARSSPLELRAPIAHDEAVSAAVRDAMRAALAGDFAALDKLELDYLNLLVRIGELFVRHPDGTPHWWFDPQDARYQRADREVYAPFVVEYHRGYGPRAQAALEWWLAEKCRNCDGKLRRLPCRVCGGSWHVADASDFVIYTDIDGVLLEEGR